MFVITAYVGGNLTKLPSDSSDSNMHHSLFPSFAELSIELITPPLIIVGSKFAFEKIAATKEVVVVFPCEPAITIFFFNDVICASISPLL